MATGGGGQEEGEGGQRGWCAICLERYQRPKLLPCFHTFCQSCLQGVAGPAPSFPCPSCRSMVILPPGGVPALQMINEVEGLASSAQPSFIGSRKRKNNFYIDEAEDSMPQTSLCDVCSEDTQATCSCLHCQQRYCGPCQKVHDSISLCRSHTVVALQPGAGGVQGGGAGQGGGEQLCTKHRGQAVVLHCVPCRANICLQCKLTAHEGHPTEDLQDTEDKVRARLQQRLETLNHQASRVQGVLSVLENRQVKLAALHSATEQGIKSRAEKARHLVTECEEKTLSSLQTLNQDELKPLSEIKEDLQHRHSALTAQAEHVTRVLRDNKDTDIVHLEASLKEAKSDPEQVACILRSLQTEAAPYSCEHNPVAINTTLQEFVGLLRKPHDRNSASDSHEHMTSGARAVQSRAHGQSAAFPRPVRRSVRVTEVTYSRNPKSRVVGVCQTSEKKCWVLYQPSGEGAVMALYGPQGRIKDIENIFHRGNMIVTVLTDVPIVFYETDFAHFGSGQLAKVCLKYSAVYLVNTSQVITGLKLNYFDSTAKSCKQFLYTSDGSQCHKLHVKTLDPKQWEETVIHWEREFGSLKDVSRSEKYFVSGKDDTARLYTKDQSDKLQLMSTYCPSPQNKILDACFFPVGGRELLLLLVEGDNRVHVVDHTDGCQFVQFLDTGDVTLKNPRLFATDQETVLWVACDGGQMVMVEF